MIHLASEILLCFFKKSNSRNEWKEQCSPKTFMQTTLPLCHCILNTNCSLDHDCCMGNYSCLAPNSVVGGNTRIGDYSYIGIGCTVFHNIEIGRNCIVGGGSLVIRDTSSDSVFFGSPAKFISSRILGDKYL